MPSVSADTTIRQYQDFVEQVYGLPNSRHYGLWDIVTNMQRFAMRALKGIRKGNEERVKLNLLITTSWFMSIMNQLHVNLEDEIWKRLQT